MTAPNLRSVLKALSSNQRVDWDAAATDADETSRGLLRELRIIARISAAHAGQPAEVDADGATRWGRLILKDRLGYGADGTVYRAFDTQLHREIALKTLDENDGASVTRFLNEARLLARVRHNNVVAVYGADVIGGRPGIWMDLIDGSTLQELVARQGPFSAQEAALIGVEVCRGLAAIHHAGIVHRDIKAQNVMREAGGRIVLMDFSVSASDARRAGLAGTPLYIAPELLSGSAPSVQSDLYSLGVLLYYLVTGAYPVIGSSLAAIARAHAEGRSTRLRDARADLPAPFVTAVDRLLSAKPKKRPRTAGDIESDLMQSLPHDAVAEAARHPRRTQRLVRSVAAAALVLALAGIWYRVSPRHYGVAPSGKSPWVLVTAFDNRSKDVDLDGLENALERNLVGSAGFRIVSRPRVDDALRLMQRPVGAAIDSTTAREIALRDGDVQMLVEGRIEQVGPSTVLTASIIDVASGLTTASVSEQLDATQAWPRGVAHIADELKRRLGATRGVSSVRQLEKVTTPSLRALRLYTESYAAGERDNWAGAMSLASQAVLEDPSFAAAHTWLAWTRSRNGQPVDAVLAEARKGLDLSVNASDWERLWIEGSYHTLAGDPARALASYEALVKIYPDHFWGVSNLIYLYEKRGRQADAVTLAVRLAELRPHDYDALYVALDRMQRTGNLERAAEYARRIRETGVHDRDPSGDAWVFDAFASWHRGDLKQTVARLGQMEAEASALDSELRDAVLRKTAALWLAIGRPTDATHALDRSLPHPERDLMRAAIAYEAGAGRDAVLKATEAATLEDDKNAPPPSQLNNWYFKMWLLSRSATPGRRQTFLRDFEQRVSRQDGIDEFKKALAGEIAAASGRSHEAAALMREFHWNEVGLRTAFQARETLANALVATGQISEAIDVLQPLGEMKHLAAYDRALWWVRCRVRLAEMYAQNGQRNETRMMVSELNAMLSDAEPGFPLKVRVQALAP